MPGRDKRAFSARALFTHAHSGTRRRNGCAPPASLRYEDRFRSFSAVHHVTHIDRTVIGGRPRRRMPPHPISLIFDLCVVVERSWRGPVRRPFRCRGRDLLRDGPTPGRSASVPGRGDPREAGVGGRDELGSAPGVHTGKRVILLFRCSGRLFERAGPAGERQRGRAPADQRTRRRPSTKSHGPVTARDKSTINPEGKQQMPTLSRAHGHIRSTIPSLRGPSSGNGRVPAEMRSAGGDPIERSCAKPDNRYLHERPGTTGAGTSRQWTNRPLRASERYTMPIESDCGTTRDGTSDDPPPPAPQIDTFSIPISSLPSARSPQLSGENENRVQRPAGTEAISPRMLAHRGTTRVTGRTRRLRAAMPDGRDGTDVERFGGSGDEASLRAAGLDMRHGPPLSPGGRGPAAMRIAAARPEGPDRVITAWTALPVKAVEAFRRNSTGESPQSNTRAGVDGRCRPPARPAAGSSHRRRGRP
ncbi:hypothetical protein HNR21_006659 [Actinomadura cellulosilytica]|uniref:Uncharacterized protein n=1 Tax=Thermomonospora cellulosilytica TaxID=1411118 RepID=A0A7W3N5D2_9ACTN|nr:hypothetical protein [Thermomonospora cellulosilytica]